MKNFSQKALVAAAVAACGVSAHAGTAAVATVRTFAVEALTSTTPVTLANATYTMGVGRNSSQGFTVIVRQPAGSATKLVCPAASGVAVNTNSGTAVVTVKRSGSTECAYDVDMSNGTVVANNTIVFTGLQLNSHGLATAGATETLNIALYDTGETARVDNSSDITFTVANSAAAVTLTANADTGTSADVGYNSGNSPLFGFLAQNGDSTTSAEANFVIGVNNSLLNDTGSPVTNAVVGNVVVTVTGDFAGLVTTFNTAAGNSVVTVTGNNATTSNPAVTYTAGNSASTAVFTVAGGTNLNQAGLNTVVNVSLRTAATQSLGTSRTFGVSAVVNPAVGAQRTLSGNSSWWTWTANAIELRSAFFNNDNSTGNLTRFFFQNTGAAASYSAACQAESGVTVTYGTAKTGSLNAGLTAINAADICTFSTGKRGSITFTINSSISKVKGVYQQAVNGSSTAYIPLERPYGVNSTSGGNAF